ncbi:MAG: cmk [Rhodospirillaceae bacterium]|nr:MAG: cmk [Rhodospirillaceae bacterium]
MIIAIDGPAAAGKGTLARRLAEWLGLAYLDTGLLYRAVGLAVLRQGARFEDTTAVVAAARRLNPAALDDPALRSEETGQAASRVAAIPSVRTALLDFQRAFAQCPPDGAKGAVLDGRDIGTVVCPDADHKLFVTARLEVRVQRRVKELRERKMTIIEDQVFETMRARDQRDREREVAPLAPAAGALILDTSEMDADAALAAAVFYVTSRETSAKILAAERSP